MDRRALPARPGTGGITLVVHSRDGEDIDRLINAKAARCFHRLDADIPDPDGFLFPLFHSGEPNNLSIFSDPVVDRELDEARRMPAGPNRLEEYREIEQRVLDQAPLLPLYHEIVLYAWNPRLRGIEFGPYGMSMVPFSRIWIEPLGTGGPMAEGAP
ncbi:MAG: hypothetical protein R3E12_12855 [Candidatus Eisenbacteria bacterium]